MRRVSAEARIISTWALLSGLTLLAWALARIHHGAISPSQPETIAVLAIAGIKVRLIMRQYMEVRTAPTWLRRACDAGLVGLMLTIAVMYAFA